MYPAEPELPRLIVPAGLPGLDTVITSAPPGPVSVTSGAVILTSWLFVPVTLYCAGFVALVQVTLVLAPPSQLKVPSGAMLTVAPVQVPELRMMVPRSRACCDWSVNGLRIRAVPVAFWKGPAARAGVGVSATAADVAISG